MKLRNLIARTIGVTKNDQRCRRRRPHAPCIDILEGRELLDGGISLIAGTIDIAGASGQNSVVVSYTDPTHGAVAVTWNNTTVDYQRSQVSSILFNGQDGFNTFYNFTDISSTATGGSGGNVFYGGTGADTFTGGDGLNVFWGNGSNDRLVGGDGTNIFYATPGAADTLVGGNGTNIFFGVSGGNDSISVGRGTNIFG